MGKLGNFGMTVTAVILATVGYVTWQPKLKEKPQSESPIENLEKTSLDPQTADLTPQDADATQVSTPNSLDATLSPSTIPTSPLEMTLDKIIVKGVEPSRVLGGYERSISRKTPGVYSRTFPGSDGNEYVVSVPFNVIEALRTRIRNTGARDRFHTEGDLTPFAYFAESRLQNAAATLTKGLTTPEEKAESLYKIIDVTIPRIPDLSISHPLDSLVSQDGVSEASIAVLDAVLFKHAGNSNVGVLTFDPALHQPERYAALVAGNFTGAYVEFDGTKYFVALPGEKKIGVLPLELQTRTGVAQVFK